MRLLLLILLAGLLQAQDFWVRWNGELTTPDQREFAQKCYEFGKQYGRGQTLAALAWMESSLGKETNHGEKSYGSFGLSFRSMRSGYSEQQYGRFIKESTLAFDLQARLAITIFEDNIEYFRRLGYDSRSAYYWAAARYNGGNTPNERYARLFNRRVAYLKTQFK